MDHCCSGGRRMFYGNRDRAKGVKCRLQDTGCTFQVKIRDQTLCKIQPLTEVFEDCFS